MSAKPDVWMPFYIGDYLADTLHLDAEQHGAYLLLLMAAWMRGGDLPNDDAQLQRIARCDKAAWKRVKPVVIGFFTASAEKLTQGRLVVEYANAVRANNAQRENGKKGGRPPKIKPEPNPNQTHGLTLGSIRLNPNETPSPSEEARAKDSDLRSLVASKPPTPDCPHEAIIAAYHETLPTLSRVRDWTPLRQTLLRNAWKRDTQRQSVDWWRELFGYVAQSDFLLGRGLGRDDSPPFEADLEWIIRPKNLPKIIEGKYENRRRA